MIWRTTLLFGLILTLITSMMLILRRQPSEIYWIGYISGGTKELSVISSEKSYHRELIDRNQDIYILSVRWSPDGQWLAVWATNSDVYVIRRKGTQFHAINTLESGVTGVPTWSPDSQQIAFSNLVNRQVDIYIANLNDGSVYQVTDTRLGERYISWSPDGQWIYYHVYDGQYALLRTSIDGTITQRLSPPQLQPIYHIWSPDEEWIAFDAITSDDEKYLFRMRPDGSGLQQLTNVFSFGAFKQWSPQNDWFVFKSFQSNDPAFFLVGTDGSDLYNTKYGKRHSD